jgi:hypothetical protein
MQLLLWKSREVPETREGFPCSGFRWVFEIDIGKRGVSAGFVHQHKFNGDTKWYSSHTMQYVVSVTNYWTLGSEHFWYDGPHCVHSLGPIHVCHGGGLFTGRCKKCESEVQCCDGGCDCEQL